MTVSRAGPSARGAETFVSDKNGKIFSISSRTLQTKPMVPPQYDPRYTNTSRGSGTRGPDKHHNQIHV